MSFEDEEASEQLHASAFRRRVRLTRHFRAIGIQPNKLDRVFVNDIEATESSVKVYYTNKFCNQGPELNVFGTTKWRALRHKLLACAKEETCLLYTSDAADE